MDILGADVADVVAVFKGDGESGGDTSGVDRMGVDVRVGVLASRGGDGLGMGVMEVRAAGADTGDNCVGVDVIVFEGEEQEGSACDRTSVVEERPSS